MKKLSGAITRRLRKLWEGATSAQRSYGMDWYKLARENTQTLAERFDVPTYRALGVVAALSPSSTWERNLSDAETAIRFHDSGRPIPSHVGTYGEANRTKAKRILDGEEPLDVLGGLKVRSFYQNLLGVEDGSVTVDRHAKGAALGIRGDKETTLKSEGEYKWIAEHYRRLATTLGVRASELQAVVWVVWRDGAQ